MTFYNTKNIISVNKAKQIFKERLGDNPTNREWEEQYMIFFRQYYSYENLKPIKVAGEVLGLNRNTRKFAQDFLFYNMLSEIRNQKLGGVK